MTSRIAISPQLLLSIGFREAHGEIIKKNGEITVIEAFFFDGFALPKELYGLKYFDEIDKMYFRQTGKHLPSSLANS